MHRLTLVCHGPVRLEHGAAFPPDDAPLDARVRPALAGLCPRLGRLDRSLTSPLLRARQTADALGLDAREEPALRDLELGRWRGQALADIHADAAEAVGAWLQDPGAAPHGGESRSALQGRVSLWLDGRTHERGHTLCVTHAAVIRAILIAVLEAPAGAFWRLDIEPLSLTDVRFDGRRWAVRAINAAIEP